MKRSWLRESILHAGLIGFAVSAAASGRFSNWLVLDGAISFAFIPASEVLAFAVLWRLRGLNRDSSANLSVGLTRFLEGNTPWLIWLVAFSAVISVIPPRSLGPWIFPIELSAIIPMIASLVVDVRFFRDEFRRSREQAIKDALIFRGVAWPVAVTYFLGIAIWAELGL